MVLLLSNGANIGSQPFHERGTFNHTRIMRINEIRVTMADNVTMALPAYHIFTGCDSVSAFSSKRELLGFTLLKKKLQYKEALQILG